MKTSSQLVAIVTLVVMTAFAAFVAYLQYRHIYVPPILVSLAELLGGYVLSQCRALATKNSGLVLPGVPLEHLPAGVLSLFQQIAANALAVQTTQATAPPLQAGQTLMGASASLLYQPPPAALYTPVAPALPTVPPAPLPAPVDGAQAQVDETLPPTETAPVSMTVEADPGPLTESVNQ